MFPMQFELLNRLTRASEANHGRLNKNIVSGLVKSVFFGSFFFYSFISFMVTKVSKGAKIRNRYNQVPHLTQDTNGKVTNSQSDTTNESQEVSPLPAGDHTAQINRRARTKA